MGELVDAIADVPLHRVRIPAGPDGHCPQRFKLRSNSSEEESICASMTWRALSH